MDENTTQDSSDVVVGEITEEKTPTRLQAFVINHPRASKVVAIIGGVTAVAGVAVTTNTVRKNRSHLKLAGEHAKESLNELSTSVSPSTDADV